MIVVVTGATGFIGRHLVVGLAAAGVEVRPIVRRRGAETPAGAAVATFDRPADWPPVLAGADAVVHLAAHNPGPARAFARADKASFRRVNVDGTSLLAEQAEAAGVPHLVFMSSARAYGDAAVVPLSEDTAGSPSDPYGRSKLDAEAELRQRVSDTAWTILRPPVVYGPGHGGVVGLIARAVSAGIPLPVEGSAARRSLLYIGNLVSAVHACLEDRAARNRLFNVTDGEAPTYGELGRMIGEAVGRPARIVSAPTAVSALVGRLPGFARLARPAVVDDRRIRETLGWRPPFDTAEGLRLAFGRAGG